MVQSFWDRPSPVLTQQELKNCETVLAQIKIDGKSSLCPINTKCESICCKLFPELPDYTCPCGSQYKPLHLIRVLNKLIRENTYRLNKTKGD
jgi:hypothetical protein